MPNNQKGTNEQASFRSKSNDVKARVTPKDSKYRNAGAVKGNGQANQTAYRKSSGKTY